MFVEESHDDTDRPSPFDLASEDNFSEGLETNLQEARVSKPVKLITNPEYSDEEGAIELAPDSSPR